MQKVELFKKEDFDQDYGHSGRCYIEFAAKRANELLNQKLGHVVFGHFTSEGGMGKFPLQFSHHISPEMTHKAYLFNIEEIKKQKPKASDDIDFLNKLINSPESISTEDLIRKTGEYLINEVIKHFKKEGTL